MKLHIITVSTDIYNLFIPNMIKSLKNLLKLKEYGYDMNFLLISDDSSSLANWPYSSNDITCEHMHTCNFPYPFNSYLKFHIIKDAIDYLHYNDDDKFIFVDADSIFRKCKSDFYDRLHSMLSMDKLHFALHPWRINDPFNSENSKNRYSCTYIANYDVKKYVQASFVMGSLRLLKTLTSNMEHWFKESYKERRIPYLIDQSVVNKVIDEDSSFCEFDYFIYTHDFFKIQGADKYIDKYISNISTCGDSYHIDNYPNIFVFQKYDPIKEEKRLF